MGNDPKPISDPLKATIARIEAKRKGGVIDEHTRQVVQAVTDEIAPGGKPAPERAWMWICRLPSDVARISPFQIMSKKELALPRQFVEDFIISKNNWGELRYTGPYLSQWDEDVFLAVLALIDDPKDKSTMHVDGQQTSMWEGPVSKIISLMGLKSDGAGTYNRIKRSIKLMRATTFELILKSGKIYGCGLIDEFSIVENTKSIRIVLHPLFYELYAKGSVTKLDVMQRAQLPGSVAKCLYRFVMSHRQCEWKGHFITVCRAINLKTNQEEKELKRSIRTGITALIKAKILTQDSKIIEDIVHLVRVVTPSRV